MLGRAIADISREVHFRLIAILRMVVKLFKFSQKPEMRKIGHRKY